jgi:AraC-like DNA-binding protein
MEIIRSVKKAFQSCTATVLELIESVGLMMCVVLATPLGFFRRLDKVFRLARYAQYLAPRGLFAPYLRARLDQRMGNIQQSANILSHIAGLIEEWLPAAKGARARNLRRILGDLYSDLVQQYLLAGQLEDAALIVIRANQRLQVERLPSNPRFDVKTAHVVKAGIAAGKILEEGGFATLMVKPGEEPIVGSKPKADSGRPRRAFSRSKEEKPGNEDQGGKIIPFPTLP